MRKLIIAGIALSCFAWVAGAKDPVIMTIDGTDILKSEFVYLYNKNSRQQLEPQSLEDYVEMFKLYKMKVADAKACGIDTTSAFLKEMYQYRKELAASYMTDSTFLKSLVDEAARRAGIEVEASHIMVMKGKTAAQNRTRRMLLDSLRNELVKGADFGTIAQEYSADASAKRNKGYLGYVTQGRYPYDFETAVYTTSEGELSQIVETPVGYHIVLSGARRPANGRVRAAHIMKLVQDDSDPSLETAMRQTIDSIYEIVAADPSVFADIARKFSDDKGSARQGGELPVFGSGEMVPEFENVAFSLAEGEISKPFRSVYGWHIIHKLKSIGAYTASELKPEIIRAASNPRDDRYRHVKENLVGKLARKHKARIFTDVLAALESAAEDLGIESALQKYSAKPLSSGKLMEIDGNAVTAGDFISYMRGNFNGNTQGVSYDIVRLVEDYYASLLTEAEEEWLYANETDYRNLLNEYHDGSLLYEVSLSKVWDRASKDHDGLDQYFNSHRDAYRWSEPRAKGFLVQSVNDSVSDMIMKRLAEVPEDSVLSVIRNQFRGVARVERILVAQGENVLVDSLMFGSGSSGPFSDRFPSCFMWQGRLINNPEEPSDVKGSLITDYQMELERKWIEDLKRRYPVKINSSEIKKLK